MRLPSILKTKTIDATYTPEGQVILTVGGKDTPALETILAAHHYDVAEAWQYLKSQGCCLNANADRAIRKGAFSR